MDPSQFNPIAAVTTHGRDCFGAWNPVGADLFVAGEPTALIPVRGVNGLLLSNRIRGITIGTAYGFPNSIPLSRLDVPGTLWVAVGGEGRWG